MKVNYIGLSYRAINSSERPQKKRRELVEFGFDRLFSLPKNFEKTTGLLTVYTASCKTEALRRFSLSFASMHMLCSLR